MDTKLAVVKQGSILETLPSPVFRYDGITSDDIRKKNSPVSSPIESPLSDSKSLSLGRFPMQFFGAARTYTDSDGLYDYPSSETVLTASSPRRNTKKCDRRRERKSSLKTNRNDKSGTLRHLDSVYINFLALPRPYSRRIMFLIASKSAYVQSVS